MKLHFLDYGSVKGGGGYGYFIHRFKMIESLSRLGVRLETEPDAADMICHIVPPQFYRHQPEKKNILFTLSEGSDSFYWSPDANKADLLVTACESSKSAFSKRYSGQIEICPEGIDPKKFPYFQRERPKSNEPFRVLFVGDVGGKRKGIHVLLEAWRIIKKLGLSRSIEIYVKASGVHNGRVQLDDNGVTWDSRDLGTSDLRDLYDRAHLFAFPSMGEGWGLTLTEAMATGLPCVWTHYSAMIDYCDESIGFPVNDFDLVPQVQVTNDEESDTSMLAETDPSTFSATLIEVILDYSEALKRGRAASDRMHRQYTWDHAAARFLEIVGGVVPWSATGRHLRQPV